MISSSSEEGDEHDAEAVVVPVAQKQRGASVLNKAGTGKQVGFLLFWHS